MEVKTYPVPCGCGATHQVRGAQAGSTFPCRCGRTVEVPSWTKLKAAAGESVLAPDLELMYLTQTRSLPLEPNCVRCGRDTDQVLPVSVVCERAQVKGGDPPLWQWVVAKLLFGLVGWLVLAMKDKRAVVHGQDLDFTLPIRVCEFCRRDVTGVAAVRDTLRLTPVYARLLDEFPRASVIPPR